MNLISSVDNDVRPVNRILAEAPILYKDGIHVVLDREPIVRSHHLLVSREDAASLVDLATWSGVLPDIEKLASALSIKNWAYFERGRAPFCTSMLAPTHAHAHLFDADELAPSVVKSLAARANAYEHKSFAEAAVSLSRCSTQYLLFGSMMDGWFAVNFPNPCFSEKRYLRRHLSENLRAGAANLQVNLAR